MKEDMKLWELIEDLGIKDLSEQSRIYEPLVSTSEDESIGENDGYIEVRDQELFIIEPKLDGRHPVLVPNPNLDVLVNNQILKRETAVFSQDRIEIRRKTSEAPYKITISDNKIAVLLQVSRDLYQSFKFKNKKRANRMMLDIETVEIKCNVEEVSSAIMEDIMKKGIAVEIYSTEIIRELINPTFKIIKVAEGLPPIPSIDSVLETYFQEELKEVIEEVDGKADYKNRLKIPNVEVGQVIAKLYPPKDGKDGVNVFGQVLKHKPPKKIEIMPKPRVRVTDVGQVIALQSGRPSITGRTIKYIDILEMYEVDGDVDMQTGNIYFTGDVLIKGHVKDNMSVECAGSIYVYGNVYQAKLTAAQNIHVMGTVINSKVVAGQLSMFYSQVYKITQDLSVSFEQLTKALSQLENSMREKSLGFDFNHVLSTLLEMKFHHIIKQVNELYDIFGKMQKNQMQMSMKSRILLNALSQFRYLHLVSTVQSHEALNSVQFSIKDLIQEMESMINEESGIHVKSANMSTIKTNGEIRIEKDGVIQSHLFAGTNIVFEKEDAVIRGGKLEALKVIDAGIVGTELGEPPELYAGERIEMKELYQSRIKFPYFDKFIGEYRKQVKFVYDPKTERVNWG